jgi:hypothetical protein
MTSREPRPSELTFSYVFTMMRNLSNCVWLPISDEAIEYSSDIRMNLEKMEKQITEETAKRTNKA